MADAEVLFRGGRYAGAYYIAGYAVECALKACIARQFQMADIPDPKLVSSIYVHDLTRLLSIADLADALRDESRADPRFELNWSAVKAWTEHSRYDKQRSRAEAEDLINALVDPDHGVMRCLRLHW